MITLYSGFYVVFGLTFKNTLAFFIRVRIGVRFRIRIMVRIRVRIRVRDKEYD